MLPTAFLQNPFPPGPAVPSSTPQGALLGMEVVSSGSRSPMTQEWSASVQRQLTSSTKLELDYFGSHSIHLVSEMVDNTATTPGGSLPGKATLATVSSIHKRRVQYIPLLL